MGMSEDDRIRSKNRHQNEAFELYESLKFMRYNLAHIMKYAELAIANSSDPIRIEVYNTMISIARSSSGKQEGNPNK